MVEMLTKMWAGICDAISNSPTMEKMFEGVCKALFYNTLKPIFQQLDVWMTAIPMSYARFCAVGLFIVTWIVVCFFLKEDYVNRGRPFKSLWTDLRVWTVLATIPHVFFYFYFT